MPNCSSNLNRVTINRRAVQSAIRCVQNYVRNLFFFQRDFFTDNGISMLLSAMNAASSVCEDSLFDLGNSVLPEGHEIVIRDLKKAHDFVVVRQKDARATSGRWFGVSSVESSIVGESPSHHVV